MPEHWRRHEILTRRPKQINLFALNAIRLSLPHLTSPHLTLVDDVSQTDKGIAPLPFIGGQPLTPALWPFGRSVQDTVGEDRSWCFRGPSLHRHRALESPFG